GHAGDEERFSKQWMLDFFGLRNSLDARVFEEEVLAEVSVDGDIDVLVDCGRNEETAAGGSAVVRR
ncbi:MAG: hypothetical protein WEE53_02665, partial [Acidimicrobiia bacterium]